MPSDDRRAFPDEIEATLRRHRVGRLAVSANDRPYVVPINYAYAGGCVYAFGGSGRKLAVMREQPLVCFEVDEVADPSEWRGVVAEGRFEELAAEPARREALARLGVGSGAVVRTRSAGGRTVVFRIRLTDRAGRFERRDA